MQQHVASDEEQVEAAEQEASPTGKKQRKGNPGLRHFVRWGREDQLKMFFAWLP